MGAGGVPNRGVESIVGRSGDLPTSGAKPNARYDLYVNGKKIQSRWFDDNGYAIRNRDYKHQNAHNNHYFPHDHTWTWIGDNGRRSKEPLPPDFINYN